MKKILQFSFLLSAVLGSAVWAAENDDRFALVVGNSAYSGPAALANPVNDARAVSSKLKALGWDVTTLENADIDKLTDGILSFADTIKTKRSPSVIFFFAGHGIELEGINYLLPIGAEKVDDQRKLPRLAYSFRDLNNLLETNGAWNTIYILDACRNDPFAKKDATRGIAVSAKPVGITSISTPTGAKGGSIALFSASSGQTSSDGTGRNGLFTEMLLKRMDSTEPLFNIFTQIRNDVNQASSGKQVPVVGNVSLADANLNFYGVRGSVAQIPVKTAPAAPGNAPAASEEPKGILKVEALVAGKLYIDDEYLGDVGPGADFEEPRPLGTWKLRFKPANGAAAEEKTAVLTTAGSSRRLVFGLNTPVAAAPAARTPVVPVPAPTVSGKKGANQIPAAAAVPALGDVGLGNTFELVVEGPEDGMQVLINGEEKGETPLHLTLPRFNWEISISHPDYEAFTQRITPRANGEAVKVSPNIDHTRQFKLTQAVHNRESLLKQLNLKKAPGAFPSFLSFLGGLTFWGGTGFAGYSYYMGTKTRTDYAGSQDPQAIDIYRTDLSRYDQWTKVGGIVAGSGLVSWLFFNLFVPNTSDLENQIKNKDAEIVQLGGR